MYSCQKTQTISPQLVCTHPYILPTLYISKMTEMTLNDITIICFSLPVGKTLCMHSKVMPTLWYTHWCPQRPFLIVFLTAAHEPVCQFCIPNSKSVTYIHMRIDVLVLLFNYPVSHLTALGLGIYSHLL